MMPEVNEDMVWYIDSRFRLKQTEISMVEIIWIIILIMIFIILIIIEEWSCFEYQDIACLGKIEDRGSCYQDIMLIPKLSVYMGGGYIYLQLIFDPIVLVVPKNLSFLNYAVFNLYTFFSILINRF